MLVRTVFNFARKSRADLITPTFNLMSAMRLRVLLLSWALIFEGWDFDLMSGKLCMQVAQDPVVII